MTIKLGYCCINNTLRSVKPSVYSSRSITRSKFSLELASERSVQNCKDLLTILEWNRDNFIRSFRIGSEPLPRSGDMTIGYSINDLPDKHLILDLLAEAGRFAHENKIHLSFHPGQYVCLGSPREAVQKLAIYALEAENHVADAICRDVNLDIPINIHIGGSYDRDYDGTAVRFIQSFNLLSSTLKTRLSVENDDKASCWSVQNLYQRIYQQTNIPICFDFHHWLFCNESDTNSLDDMYLDFKLAHSTWNGRDMQVHYSESPTPDKLITKHSDYYTKPIPDFVTNFDCHIHLECKAKEYALLKYRQDFNVDY